MQGDEKMDILCLMGLFPEEYREEIEKCSKAGVQNAANKLQWAIVKGLDQIPDVSVSIVNSLYIGSYPKRYKKCFIPTFAFSHTEGAKDINVGFCNLTGLKFFSRYHSSKKAVRKWAEAPSNEEKVLLIYALTIPFSKVAKYVRKKYPHIKVCIVVPDLPEYMSAGGKKRNAIYNFAKQKSIGMIRRHIRDVNHFVLLTDAMKEWFDHPISYTVVEGIAGNIANDTESQETRRKSILYAGGISAEYGVVDLVKSFVSVAPKEWELDIFGNGKDLQTIKALAADFPNVKIHGLAPNPTVVESQKTASLLVNPRRNQPFTKYSFPSKILEYMSSGTPVLAYKLDGMPDDYDEYFFHIEEAEGGLENALRHVISLSDEDRARMGQKAKDFVAQYKNPKAQCTKIIALLSRQ